MSVIRWEDPPTEHGNAKPKKPPKFQPIADALRGRPNEWALIDDSRTHGSAGSFAHHIRNGSGPWAPAGTFEAKVIGSAGASRARVYARYVGEPSPAAKPRAKRQQMICQVVNREQSPAPTRRALPGHRFVLAVE